MDVPVRELKARLSEYLRRVQQGEEVVITQRGRPVGRIVPADVTAVKTKAEVVRDLRSLPGIRPARGPGSPGLPDALPYRPGEKMLSDMVAEDRG